MTEPTPNKRVLVVHYSQTGQLTRALQALLAPLRDHPQIQLTEASIGPRIPYPFPWRFLDFLDVFPESVALEAPEMAPVTFDPDAPFDLIILAYQVWFLSPSLPMTGFLKSDAARVLKNRPVITLIACRNMWLTAQAKLVGMLETWGARLLDNIVLVDHGPPWSTFVTTPRWLLTGRQDAFWKIFPAAGVSTHDIAASARFGRALREVLPTLPDGWTQPLLQGLGAVRVDPGYIASERIGHRSFLAWGRLLRWVGRPRTRPRRAILIIYAVFLALMIMTVVPVTLTVAVLLRPLLRRRLQRAAQHLEQPSGSSQERCAQYL